MVEQRSYTYLMDADEQKELPVVIEGGTGHSPHGGFFAEGETIPPDLRGIRVRYKTFGDSPSTETGPCKECSQHDKQWMDIEKAENLIPVHPNCVCYYEFDDDTELRLSKHVDISKPYENEHACRLEDPDEYDNLRRENGYDEVDGKQLDVIWGVEETDDDDVVERQAFRYPVEEWDVDEAESHCDEHDSIKFEPAAGEEGTEGCLGCGGKEATMNPETTKTVTKSADGVVTREIRGEDRELIKVPISSTREDRDGDNFSTDGLQSMQSQIREEQPLVFLNHGFTDFGSPMYDARDTIGTQVDAEVSEEGDKDVLDALILPDLTHEEGERMLEQAKNGQAIKFSVGFGVLDYDEKTNEAGDVVGREFNAVDLMETSKVGIPSQPDASVTAAAKAAGLAERLGESGTIDDEESFARALASELVTRDGPITSETVEEGTPVAVDGDDTVTAEEKSMNEGHKEIDEDELIALVADHVGEDEETIEAQFETWSTEEPEETEAHEEEEEVEEQESEAPGDDERLAELEKTVEEMREALESGDAEEATTSGGEAPGEEKEQDAETESDSGTDSQADETRSMQEDIFT